MKLSFKLFLIATITLLISTAGCTSQNSGTEFPESCVENGFSFEDNNLVLNPGSQKVGLYLMQNRSDGEILLNIPPKKDPGADAGWGSMLGASSWSAIAMSTENFKFSCYNVPSGGGLDVLDCNKVLSVCKFKNAVLSSSDGGSYWVAENKPLQNLLDAIKARGISF